MNKGFLHPQFSGFRPGAAGRGAGESRAREGPGGRKRMRSEISALKEKERVVPVDFLWLENRATSPWYRSTARHCRVPSPPYCLSDGCLTGRLVLQPLFIPMLVKGDPFQPILKCSTAGAEHLQPNVCTEERKELFRWIFSGKRTDPHSTTTPSTGKRRHPWIFPGTT